MGCSRRIDLDFPDFKEPYCLAVSFLWCAFFAVHSTGTLAVVADQRGIETWLIYLGTGFHLSTVAVADYWFRQFWFRDYCIGPVNRASAKWPPAEKTVRGRRSLAWWNSYRYRLGQR